MPGELRETEQEVVLDPPGKPTGTVIWLHGLGADGYDFLPMVRELGLAARGLRVVLPHAPQRPVTVNGGYVMRAWYDLRHADFDRSPDEAGVLASVRLVGGLVERERAAGVPTGRILVGGFSQGGAVALQAGLIPAGRLAGVVGLSTYLPLPDRAARERAEAALGLPVFLGHGLQDPLIPVALARRTAQDLESAGCRVELHLYGMPHSVCPAEVSDLARWLSGVLG
jgi:phospholipase/carboxylesterase